MDDGAGAAGPFPPELDDADAEAIPFEGALAGNGARSLRARAPVDYKEPAAVRILITNTPHPRPRPTACNLDRTQSAIRWEWRRGEVRATRHQRAWHSQPSRAAERAEAGLVRRPAKRPRRDAPFDVQRARATAFALGFGADEVTAEEAELLPQGYSTAKYALVCFSAALMAAMMMHGPAAGVRHSRPCSVTCCTVYRHRPAAMRALQQHQCGGAVRKGSAVPAGTCSGHAGFSV